MKKRIFIKYQVVVLVATLFLASCYKDIGNYDYTELNQITFSGIAENYTIDVGMPLTIKPVMNQTIPGFEDDYEYVWLDVGNGSRTWDTIYRERYIDNAVLSRLAANATHKMIYQVIDTVRGLKYTSDYFFIRVNNDIRQGFMLLLNDGGKTDLRFINYYTSITGGSGRKLAMRPVISPNLPELGAPIGIATYVDNYAPMPGISSSIVYAVSLLTETGLYRLLHNDFSYKKEYNGSYVILGDMSDVHFTGIYPPVNKTVISNYVAAMLRDDKGNFMYYQYGAMTMGATFIPWKVGVFCNKYVNDNVEQRFTPFESFGFQNTFLAVFYDLDSRSFVLKAAGRNYCQKFTSAETLFEYNNTPFDPLWVYMRPADNLVGSNAVYSVVKNRATGALDLVSFTAALATSVQAKYKLWPQTDEGTTLPGINNAKRFLLNVNGTSTDYRSLFYYATDTEIHIYDLLDKSFRKVFTAPAGATIVDMKFIVSQTVTPAANANNDFANNMIIVTKGSGPNSTTVGIYTVAPIYGTLDLRWFDNSEGGMNCIWENLPDYVGIDWKAKS